MRNADESIQIQHGAHHGVLLAAGQVRMVWTRCWLRAHWGGWLEPALDRRRSCTAYCSTKEWRWTSTDIIDKFPKLISGLYLHSSHVFVIYFEGSSVQFFNQDCRLKTWEDDDYLSRDQVQIIALFSLFCSDYHVFWCHFNFVFLMFRLLSNKILLVFILFKLLIQIKNFKSIIFHIWESRKWWQHYICHGTAYYYSRLSSDCFLPSLRRMQGY